MEMTLQRYDADAHRTIGKLTIGGNFEAFTLEDTVRPPGHKIRGKTAIPVGRYRVILTFSSRFNRILPLLLQVFWFIGVRIHAGNTAADTEGCILVGERREKNAVIASRVALEKLQSKIKAAIDAGEQVWITVENPPEKPEG